MAAPIPTLDLAALAWFAIALVGYQVLADYGPVSGRAIAWAMQHQRVAWMLNMSRRDNRTVDAILLGGLSHGNAFFASTSAIAIGGLSAILASGDKAQALLERIPYVAKSPAYLWEIKVILLMAVFVYAFFKFAWAFRLSHYTAIMIGATPLDDEPDEAARRDHAERTAELLGIAAEHANRGLRSYYYAFATMAWFFHPVLFIAATTWVVAILARRDFFSRSRNIVAGR
ncbi:MAG: DUF599 domain-containing protein [Pseudomonadota bacterium]